MSAVGVCVYGGSAFRSADALKQLELISRSTRETIGIFQSGSFTQADPAARLDLEKFLQELIWYGLVADSAAARAQIECIEAGGYTEGLNEILRYADSLKGNFTELHKLEVRMLDNEQDSPEAVGTFELLRASSLTLAKYSKLQVAFQTFAIVSRETILVGYGKDSLMTGLNPVEFIETVA